MESPKSALKVIIAFVTPICILGGFLPYIFLYLDSSHSIPTMTDYLIMIGLSFFIWFLGWVGLKIMKNGWGWFQKKSNFLRLCTKLVTTTLPDNWVYMDHENKKKFYIQLLKNILFAGWIIFLIVSLWEEVVPAFTSELFHEKMADYLITPAVYFVFLGGSFYLKLVGQRVENAIRLGAAFIAIFGTGPIIREAVFLIILLSESFLYRVPRRVKNENKVKTQLLEKILFILWIIYLMVFLWAEVSLGFKSEFLDDFRVFDIIAPILYLAFLGFGFYLKFAGKRVENGIRLGIAYIATFFRGEIIGGFFLFIIFLGESLLYKLPRGVENEGKNKIHVKLLENILFAAWIIFLIVSLWKGVTIYFKSELLGAFMIYYIAAPICYLVFLGISFYFKLAGRYKTRYFLNGIRLGAAFATMIGVDDLLREVALLSLFLGEYLFHKISWKKEEAMSKLKITLVSFLCFILSSIGVFAFREHISPLNPVFFKEPGFVDRSERRNRSETEMQKRIRHEMERRERMRMLRENEKLKERQRRIDRKKQREKKH